MNRDELDLHREHLDLTDALAAAKQAHRTNPTDDTRTDLASAKAAIREFREHWRTIRAAFAPTPGEGDAVAEPATVQAATKVRS